MGYPIVSCQLKFRLFISNQLKFGSVSFVSHILFLAR